MCHGFVDIAIGHGIADITLAVKGLLKRGTFVEYLLNRQLTNLATKRAVANHIYNLRFMTLGIYLECYSRVVNFDCKSIINFVTVSGYNVIKILVLYKIA